MEKSPIIEKTPVTKDTKVSKKVWLYKIKITLKVHEKVTRTLILPAELRLDQVHQIIQEAFGWYDYHLHSFETKGESYVSDIEESWIDDDIDEKTARLCDILTPDNKSIVYTYDFGDYWQHKITLMSADYQKAVPQPIYCEKAVGATPPEDCGGPGGYYDFCKMIADPNHPERASMLEWRGIEPDDEIPWPDKVYINNINLALQFINSKPTKPVKEKTR